MCSRQGSWDMSGCGTRLYYIFYWKWSKRCTYHSGPNCIISGKKIQIFFSILFWTYVDRIYLMQTVFILCGLYFILCRLYLSYSDCIYPIRTVFAYLSYADGIYPMRAVFSIYPMRTVFIQCGLYLSYADCLFPHLAAMGASSFWQKLKTDWRSWVCSSVSPFTLSSMG
jgi:hypothetical protein